MTASKFCKIVVFVPVEHAEKIRETLANAGAGKMGEYDACSFSSKGVGRFRPSKNAKPFMGEAGKIEAVDEERIETICAVERVQEVLQKVRSAHPYEEPAIDVLPLLG